MTNFDATWRPLESPIPTNSWLVALKVCVLIGAIMLLLGSLIALLVDSSVPRYFAMFGAFSWAVGGIGAIRLSKTEKFRNPKGDWNAM